MEGVYPVAAYKKFIARKDDIHPPDPVTPEMYCPQLTALSHQDCAFARAL